MSDLFEAAFTHAGVGMALVSAEGRFIRVNAAFQALLGFSEAEMLATDFQTITHPDDLDIDLELLGRLADGDIPNYTLDKRYIHSDGSLVWAQLTVSVTRHADGSPACYIAQVQDLTERIGAEHALLRREARYPACRRLLGYEPEEMIGTPGMAHVHPDDVRGLQTGFDALKCGVGSVRIRWRARHKSGDRWVWLESSPALMPRGDVLGAVVIDVVRDVTEEMLRDAALAEARREADDAVVAKAEFLANMSHEIRTPLTAVIGFADLLGASELDATARGYVHRIETAGRGLLRLVNDILDYSRMEAGQLQIAPLPTSPCAILEEVTAILGPAAEAKGLTLRTSCPIDTPKAALLDADRLRQVMLNLGANAIKFTETGEVALALTWDPADETLLVTVSDTGPGMTAEERARLFKRFSQVGTPESRIHGAGLGLAICRTLVEAMHGRIDVRSQPGEGSCFTFRIPAPAVQPDSARAELPMSRLGGLRVMIVDDNESNRRLARAILESHGAEIVEADDGLSAVELANAAPCDVIIMDVRMPGLDGPSALLRIRSQPGPNRRTPILAFTAGAEDAGLEDFDDIVPKPILAESLLLQVLRAAEAAAEGYIPKAPLSLPAA